MLDKIDLTQSLTKDEYRRQRSILRNELLLLQRSCWQHKIPVIVVFEGWKGTGKAGIINSVTQPLEPRGFQLHSMQAQRTFEMHMPWLWRFWQRIPNYGEIAIFDGSWYRRVLVERVEGNVDEKGWRQAYRDIDDFERVLADDGYKICKFLLHTSKKEQKKRFRKLESDALTAWHMHPEDWRQNERYEEYVEVIEEMLELTESEWAPWTIVECVDKRWARIKVLETMAGALADSITARGLPLPELGYEDEYLSMAEDVEELGKPKEDDG
ncbi:MAG: hypothetical protein OEQ74_00670 [Gammaproteobacteria bacterium]|nr:hypothetical protein [Gammaproteobacteria bacterium]